MLLLGKYIADDSNHLTLLLDVREWESQDTRPRCWMERIQSDILVVLLLTAGKQERSMGSVLAVVVVCFDLELEIGEKGICDLVKSPEVWLES